MREHRTKDGRLFYYASRAELERLKGYKGNDRRGRACCPIHDGDNPTALSIDWATGWARCFHCGDAWAIRVEDHPDAKRPGDTHTRPVQNRYSEPQHRPSAAQRRRRDTEPVAHDLDALQASLELAIAGAMDALPGSPGQRYLEARGIALDVALSLGIGWGRAGELKNRVVFPLSGPDGHPTSATGRRLYETDNKYDPKYKALDSKAGYIKTLFNGGAIAQARRTGHPLIIVEGPLDAAACAAAGLPLTVAIGSTSYPHPEHFAGLSTAILALDGDKAGQAGRRSLWLELTARGVEVLPLPASALDGCKDLGEYWQTHRTMPAQLMARAIGPHLPSATPATTPSPDTSAGTAAKKTTPAADDVAQGEGIDPAAWPSREYLQWQGEQAQRALELTPDDLPADLRAEAEALARDMAADPDFCMDFWADLSRNETTLSAEDRVAAWHAVNLACKLINAATAA